MVGMRERGTEWRRGRAGYGRTVSGCGLAVCFSAVTHVEDTDSARCGVVLVYHAVVANPDSVDALGPDQLPAVDRSRVARQPFDCGDDARYLLAVYPTQVTLG
jgi:hypothetical protein